MRLYGKLAGRKLVLLGARDGVSGDALTALFAESGAEIVYAATECMG